jgi:hypothetical protein
MGTLAFVLRFPVGISCKGDFHGPELLDKQLRGTDFSRRNDSVTGLMVVAMFFAGMIVGGIAFTHDNEPIRTASNYTTAAMACDDNGGCRIRSHPPTVGSLVHFEWSMIRRGCA